MFSAVSAWRIILLIFLYKVEVYVFPGDFENNK